MSIYDDILKAYAEAGDYRDELGRLRAKDGRVKSIVYENGVEWSVLTREQARENANRGRWDSEDGAAVRRYACFQERFEDVAAYTLDKLGDDINAAAVNAVKSYAAAFPDMERKGSGLVLFGGTGVGKTYLAASLCNELIDSGRRCRFTSMADIEGECAGDLGAFSQVMARICSVDLVALDDFGKMRATRYAAQFTYDVVSWLTSKRMPLVVTTNLTRSQLASPRGEAKAVIDRLKQCCTLVEVTGTNKRQIRL